MKHIDEYSYINKGIMRYKGEYSYINERLEDFEKDLAKAKSFEKINKVLRDAEDTMILLSNDWFYVPNEKELRTYLNDKAKHLEEKMIQEQLKKLNGRILRSRDLEDIEGVIEDIIKVRKDHLWESVKPDESEGEFDAFFPLLEKARLKAIQDVTKRVSIAKKYKELEALAQEVGSLQAQPQYVKEYKKVLDDLQAKIEEKYSLLGKGMRFIKKLFRRGRRASQIRTASQMLNQLNKEISDLKKEL